ncbi:hypothetical protein MMC19_001704 [Ptychographa xylographoides]|nr:hypothetical protein [Ptychographa xylographoides]
MVPRKRGRAEMESSEPAPETSQLTKLRNMWEFANVMQYIFIFGKAVKIDEDFDIEDFEAECLKAGPSEKLAEIGLCLLKFVSSHRGLTPELFDEYTRRQYLAKAPSRNPFGMGEDPAKFNDFDIATKLRVLFQLSRWTLINADRMKERMPETKDTDQTAWRIEEVGYDRQERLYFVLDDNRLYRRTDPALPSTPPPKAKAKPKAKSKAGKAAARASKRRKTAEGEETVQDQEINAVDEMEIKKEDEVEELDTFGGRKWECLAVNLAEYRTFLEGIQKSRDPDEKVLYSRLIQEVMPVIEKQEEDCQKKIARRQKELMNLEKLATAKRSSRLAGKQEREREEQEALIADQKRRTDLIAAKKDAERQRQMEEARESRMLTREQRLKEREYKRLLHEEELANLSEDNKKLETGEARMSERHLKAEMEKKKKALEQLAQEDEWVFDCSICGVHGVNIDDGSHSVACEQCNVWQHSSCLGISQTEAEKEDFHFICSDCKRKIEDAKKPKIPPLKFRLGASSSPPSDKSTIHVSSDRPPKRKSVDLEPGTVRQPPMKKFKPYFAPLGSHVANGSTAQRGTSADMQRSIMNGPTLSPQGQMTPHQGANGQPLPPPGLASSSQPPHYRNGQFHPGAEMGPATNVNGYPLYRTPYATDGDDAMRQFSQASQNPFHNSFHRQRPVSSHSNNGLHSPLKTRPSMSPTQGSHDIGPLAFPPSVSNTPHSNGLPPYQPTIGAHSSPYTGTRPFPSSSPATSFPPPSSPIIPPPSPDSQAPLSGLSPSKQSPPRTSLNHNITGTPIMPPAAQLLPSPQIQDPHPPVKTIGPEQPQMTNGQIYRQVNGQINGQGIKPASGQALSP